MVKKVKWFANAYMVWSSIMEPRGIFPIIFWKQQIVNHFVYLICRTLESTAKWGEKIQGWPQDVDVQTQVCEIRKPSCLKSQGNMVKLVTV